MESNMNNDKKELEQNKSIMEAWTSFLKTISRQKDEDIEKIFCNILEVIRELINQNVFSREEISSESEKYFLGTFLVELVKAIITDSTNDLVIKQLEKEILSVLVKEFVNNMENPKLIPFGESLVIIFSDDQNFYKNRQNEDGTEVFLEKINSILNPDAANWRESLEVGSKIDFLKKDSFSPDSTLSRSVGIAHWARAEILSIDQNKKLSLRIFGTGQYISNISIFSSEILPFKTLSDDFEWRESLKKGDEIDFLDNKSWCRSTVLMDYDKHSILSDANNPDQKRNYIRYGLRIYRETGRCEDSQKRKYFGWTESFDKEISVHDSKVRRPNEFSKIISNYHMITSYPIDSRKFNEMETYIPFEINNRKFYIIPKKFEGRTIDYLYYNLINQFCEEDLLLDKIMEVLSSQNVNYDLLSVIVEIIHQIHPFLHIKYSQTFLKQMINQTLAILRRFSMQEVRNFKRDKVETMIKRLKDILIRVYIDVDANVIFDIFGIDFGLNCLRSQNILDKKLLGLKILTETLTDATRSSASSSIGFSDKHLSPPYLMARVFLPDQDGNSIFDILYGSQSHSQILQKSPDLLKTFFLGRVLTTNEIEKLFQIIKEATDSEIKNVIYKGIQQNANHMNLELQVYILRKLIEVPADKLTKMDLDLLTSTLKALPSYANKDIVTPIADYTFDLVFHKSNLINPKLYETVVDEFVSLMKTFEFRHIVVEYVVKIVDLLKDKTFDFIKVIKIMRKLLSTLMSIIEDSKKQQLIHALLGDFNKDNEDTLSTQSSIQYSPNSNLNSNNEVNVIDLTIKFLCDYHEKSKILISGNEIEDSKRDFSSFDLYDRVNTTSHSEIMSEVTQFFSLFHILKDFYFTYDQIDLLYKIYVEEFISHNDANIFFKWLKEAEDKKAIPTGAFEIVFAKMIANNNLEFSNITSDLFNCLWNIFTTINKTYGKININKDTQAYSGVSNSGQILLSYSYNNDDKIDLKCDNPLEMAGFELIWKLVISCNNTGDVIKNAIENILKLFLNNDLEPAQRGQVWNLIMQKCITSIQNIKIQNLNKEEKKKKITNCLNILKSLIEETEKKGTAGCVSNSSILKNSILTLKISNFILGKGIERESKPDNTFTLRVYSNTTIWDLKNLIGKKIGVVPELIKFLSSSGNSKEISDNDHGKTLNDLKIKNNDTMSVVKNPILDKIPKVNLITNNKLSDKAVKAFTEIFERFSTDGQMSRDQCALFTTCAIDSNEVVVAEDKRVKDAFQMYDLDRDDFLTLSDFLRFYSDSVVVNKKINVVWENLKSFNFRNDLKKLNEPLDEYNTVIQIMPRFVLSKNQEYFNTIFELQDEEESLAREASKFLSMICTNPLIYRHILIMDNFVDWNNLLDSSNYYKLLYSLQIIESFFEEFDLGEQKVDNEALEFTILDESDRELLFPNHKLAWIEKFLSQGGISHIINNIFLKSKLVVNNQYKRCLNLILKVIRGSLSLLFRAKNSKNSKDEVIQLIRKESLTPESALTNLNEEEVTMSSPIVKIETKNELENNLIQMINNNYGDEVINKMDFHTIVYKLLTNSYEFFIKLDSDTEERTLVNNSINLVSLIIVSQDNISNFLNNNIYNFSFIYNDKTVTFADYILSGLFHSNFLTKLNFHKTFSSLSDSLSNLKEYSFTYKLLEILNNKITNLSQIEKEQSKYFFELFQSLLNKCLKIKTLGEEDVINYEELAINLVNILTNESDSLVEELLVGYMKILNVILSNRDNKFKSFIGIEKDLINTLIDKYLIQDVKFQGKESQNNFELINPDEEKYKKLNNNQNVKTSDCRINIFNLIFVLVSDNLENINKLFSTHKWTDVNLYTSKLKNEKRYYNPSSDKRSHNGFIGIKNLQCICYMLAVIQQFFNVPSFRYAIMQANDMKKPNYTDDNKETDDNILHQLQKMFVYMELSNRSEFNPVDFCYAFKGLDGLPTNIRIQQDSQEFLGRIFDIGEQALKDTEYKYLFQSVFLGKTCSQVICKGGCGKIRNTFEDFYSLSLEVLNKKSLTESLDKFISEDKIDDYNCDTCKKKVSVVKRTSFAELPNVLIVHLQRLYFNYESLSNEKINSRLEFPKRLNLKEFCSESINKSEMEENKEENQNNIESDKDFNDRVYYKEDEYYQYELVGVVVHMGVAEAGHYYSYINVKREGSDDKMNYDPSKVEDVEKWLTFNDSSVTSFQLKNLEEDCFGGVSNSVGVAGPSDNNDIFSLWDNPKNNSQTSFENSKNAYMLVYERINKSHLKMKIENEEMVEKLQKPIVTYDVDTKYNTMKTYDIFNSIDTPTNDQVSLDCENTVISRRDNRIFNNILYDETLKEYSYYVPFYSLKKVIPSSHFFDVTMDNVWFNNDQKIYSATFVNFLEKLLNNVLKMLKEDINNIEYKIISKMFSTVTKYLIEIVSKSNFKDNLKKIIENMNEIIKIYPELSNIILDYINSDKERIISDTLITNEESANIAYKNLILCAILENFKLNENTLKNKIEIITPPCIILMDYLYSLIPTDASKQWTRILAFLELFEGLVKSELEIVYDYLFEKETIYIFIDFMLGKESPLFKKGETRTEMGNKVAPPKFYPLINVISTLVRCCYTDRWTEEDNMEGSHPHTLMKTIGKVYTMSERDQECVNNSKFYKKAITGNFYNIGLSKMLAHLIYNNYKTSKYRIFTIIEAINETITPSDAKNAFDLLYNILLIEDKYTLIRLEWIFGIPQTTIKTADSPSLVLRDSKYGEKIVRFISPLNYGTNFESLIEKTLTKYQASAEFISILNYLFASVFSKKHILNYFDSLPHPRKDELSLKDYLFDLANEEIERLENINSLKNKFEKPIKGMKTIMDTYDVKKLELLGETENKMKFAPRYKFGNIIRERISNLPCDKINIENVHCLVIDYDVEIHNDNLQSESFVIGSLAKIEDEIDTDILEDYIDRKINPNEININEEINNPNEFNNNNDYQLLNEKPNDLDNAFIEEEENINNISNEAVQGDLKYQEPDVAIVDLIDGGDNDRNEVLEEMKMIESKSDNVNSYQDAQNNMVDEYPRRRNRSEDKVENFIPKAHSYNSPNEENYIRNNLGEILESESFSRTFTERITNSSNNIIINAIRRYVIFNDSGKDFKVRLDFSSEDDFVNTYIPQSQIIVYAKKNSINNVHTFIKEDINFPWNEIEVLIQLEDHEDSVNNDDNNGNDNGKTVKKSQSFDNLKSIANPSDNPALPAGIPTVSNNPIQESEIDDFGGFDMTCEKCGYSNLINPTNPNYTCQKCKKDLF